MFQNIKVDIIYYKTTTDFEMEFNLSGCCRMRLLTDKAPDRKILVSQMARAVSRSRIIIIAGSLFSDDGIIKTAATAIGKKTLVVDNNQFGIVGEETIEIIENAIPLVNAQGIFGGCIIEQGPQTLILLTENKNIRKELMQTLIHPYIKEVCAAELMEKTPEQEEEPESDEDVVSELEEQEENSENELILDDGDEPDNLGNEIIVDDATLSGDELIHSENDVYDENDKLAEEIVLEDEAYLEDMKEYDKNEPYEDRSDELVFEPEFFNKKRGEVNTYEYAYSGLDADAYIDGSENEGEDDAPQIPKIKGYGINLPIILISALLMVIVLILCYCIFVVPAGEGVSAIEYLKEAFGTLFG